MTTNEGIKDRISDASVARGKRIAWSAAMGLFQRFAQGASTLVLMPLILHALGPTQFGIWGAAASLAWLTTLLDIGTGSALVTLVARSSATENTEEARRHLAGALTFGCGLAALMLVLALAAMVAGISVGTSGVYLVAAVGLAFNVPLNAANNVWMALQEGYVAASWELVQTVITFGGLIAAADMSRNLLVFVGVVYGGLVLGNLGSLMHLVIRHRELRPDRQAFSMTSARNVAKEGMLYFLMGVTGGLSIFLDNVLALQLLGPEASAQMTIAMRICMSAIGVLLVVSQPLWPAFAEAAEVADRHWVFGTLKRATIVVVGLALGGSLILVLFGEKLLRIWLGTSLGFGQGLLIAMGAWITAQALFRVPNLLLNGLSIIRFQIGIFIASSSVALMLKFLLSKEWGVAGILWATTLVIPVILLPASVLRIKKWADS